MIDALNSVKTVPDAHFEALAQHCDVDDDLVLLFHDRLRYAAMGDGRIVHA